MSIYGEKGLRKALFGIELDSLPNDKILDWSKLKAFADDKINVTEKHYLQTSPGLDFSLVIFLLYIF